MAQTHALAVAVASLVTHGDLLVLVGGLGAGKTAFVKGFAAGLDVADRVTSPTFTLANRYTGRLVVNHLDVYRFEQLDEVADLALPELLEDGVTVVEWGDMIAPALPSDQLEVSIEQGETDDERRVRFDARGPSWSARRVLLAEALSEWVEDGPRC